MDRASDSRPRELEFESFAVVSDLGKGRSLALFHCTNEYLAMNSGSYLCPNNFRALIAAWLNVSQRRLTRTSLAV